MGRIPDQVEAEWMAEEQFDSSDPKQVNNARKKAARKQKERLLVMETLLQDVKTRAWLWELIEGCNPYDYHVVPGDPYMSYFYWGQQNVGKRLLADAAQFPELYVLMANEARNRK